MGRLLLPSRGERGRCAQGGFDMSLSSHQSPHMESDVWLTPPEILAKLGDFDLDPCSSLDPPWPTAAHHLTVLDDGLQMPWAGRVWLNPPFGRQAIHWMRRMADHGNGIALLPGRTETAMFFETVWGRATALCFLKGRPHFHRPTGERAPFNSGAPIVLIAYGSLNAMYLMRSGLGSVVREAL